MFRNGGRRVESPSQEAQVVPNHTYAVIRIGAAEFAYSTGDRYLRALGQAWAAGLTPDLLPSTMGRDLPSVARGLRGVDIDLGAL